MGKLRGNPEKQLQRSIIEFIKVKYPFIELWKQNSTATYSFQKKSFLAPDKYTKKGISDILGVMPDGRWLAIEVKIKPNKPTVEQFDFLQMIANRQGIAIIAYDMDEAEQDLILALKKYQYLPQNQGQSPQVLEGQVLR